MCKKLYILYIYIFIYIYIYIYIIFYIIYVIYIYMYYIMYILYIYDIIYIYLYLIYNQFKYKSVYLDNIAQRSYLFDVDSDITFCIFFSNDRNGTNIFMSSPGIRSSLRNFLTKYMKKTRFNVCLTTGTTLHGQLTINVGLSVLFSLKCLK